MKKFLTLLLAVLLLVSGFPGPVQVARAVSDPISHGQINTVTYVRWGKSELYPVLGMVGPTDEFDVYEYDKNWVMVLYDTWISQGNTTRSHSFFGYVKRSEIDCDPPLEGDESAKADTGPGKRKGKKPKNRASPAPSAGVSEQPSAEPTEQASEQPEPTPYMDEMEEYDWIIRTNGTSTQSFDAGDGIIVHASFSLMAQKAGGTAPSSDPAFNHGMHTPYAATAYLSLVCKMSDAIENWGLSELMQGSGGWEINIRAPSSRFFLDTGSEDFALVNLSIPAASDAKIDPSIKTDTVSGSFFGQVSGAMSIPVQLQRSGGGYRFVLKNMRPGGGDLTFPAVLEKTFADEDRWQKKAREADEARRKAEDARRKMEEEARKKAEEAAKESPAPAATEEPLAPLVTDEIPLAPLVTPDPLAPLVPEEPLAPLAPVTPPPEDIPLAPLVPLDGENVENFPGGE